jgi:DNA-binding HxlR family transcriptional regulator
MPQVQETHFQCPGESILKLLSGKWKPQILYLATRHTLRFNSLIKELPGSSKQAVASALRELEEAHLLSKTIVRQKPLHIEYVLTEKGKSMLSVYKLASSLAE